MSVTQGDTTTLTAEFTDGSGSFADPTSPLVSVLDPLGVTIVADAVPTRDSLGHYSYDYTVPSDATLGTWIARWSGDLGGTPQTGDDEFEVIAGPPPAHYVSIDDLRALPNLGDDVKFPDEALADARDWFETTFEDFVGMAFVPRTDVYLAQGDGSPTLMLPHYPVRSITSVRVFTTATDFTDYTSDQLAALIPTEWGEIRTYAGQFFPWSPFPFSLFGAPSGDWMAPNLQITYVHGQAAAPADVKREAKIAIQEKLLQDNSGRTPDRTYGTAQEGVFVRNLVQDEEHPFGIASVDALARRYRKRYRVPEFG